MRNHISFLYITYIAPVKPTDYIGYLSIDKIK